ncbi:Conserved hypothetical protein [Herminiimonas arsenicoxydans]|uniref:Membrane bound FAD containing D-sorbitol dehydrogenase n=1 Tax=Herminiimonas arsenicoxydans TaxID=204773 RepID=A4G841_HERAR|nr:Conserved hypothetical protein [Herminiimonas arsenicoxydans]
MDTLGKNADTLPFVPTRRRLLVGMLSAYTASLIPWAWSQPVRDDKQGAFLAVSAILVGRTSLDAIQAKRLYDALTANDSEFPKKTQALLVLIEQRKIDPLQLQQTLDTEHSALADIPRKIATAWLLGIVGDGVKARAFAYETALNAVIVSDVLKPPTYCFGAYGSWGKKPIKGASDA